MKDFVKAFDMIESLQKRIVELDRAWNSAQDRIAKLEKAFTIERQRREECEAALRLWMLDEVQDARAEKARVAYFVRYASEGKP